MLGTVTIYTYLHEGILTFNTGRKEIAGLIDFFFVAKNDFYDKD